jgi:hypothetical protein
MKQMKLIDFSRQRKRQSIGIVAAVILVGATVVYSSIPAGAWFHSPGPINKGHQGLSCDSCHDAADGTLRQQLQANVRYWLGLRKSGTEVGHKAVDNNVCLDCHLNPKDSHPVYRFLEPRYIKARQQIQPQYCKSCHYEHRGVRVSIDPLFCKTCHEKLNVKNDPLDQDHAALVKGQRWETCLGCHDFHGNHKRVVPQRLADALSEAKIMAYFRDDRQIYSNKKKYEAKKVRGNDYE